MEVEGEFVFSMMLLHILVTNSPSTSISLPALSYIDREKSILIFLKFLNNPK